MSTTRAFGEGAAPPPPRQPPRCPWCGEAVAESDTRCPSCERDIKDTRIGALIGGRYRIESLLGQGGMGRVYRAMHVEIGEPVALKFLLAEWATRPEARARFKREAVALARLRHPSIVQVVDFGEHEGSPYLVMELVHGAALIDFVLRDGRTLAVSRAAWIIDQVLQVLEAAHGAGIVHRDLKPENVMLYEAGDHVERIKVLDFGLALMDDRGGGERLTSAGAIRGTPLYMSPEQCRGRDVGTPTDIYAVGVMLYELLAGETPFGGESSTDVMAQHVYAEPPPISQRGVKQSVPPGLEALVMRALSKTAAQRPTAAEFRSEMQIALRGDDDASRAAAAAEARARSAGQSRGDRALHAPPVWNARTEHQLTEPGPRAPAGVRALLVDMDDAKAIALRDALAVSAGVHASHWTETGPPGATHQGEAVRVILVGGGATGAARVRDLRAAPATQSVPVLVLDVARAEETAALIRAGASDVAMNKVPTEAIVQKVLRLVRRGR